MFENSLVESSGALKSKSSRYVWVTGALNASVVAIMILIPLLYPEALPRTAMTAMLSAPPPPPPAAPPPPSAVTKVVKVTAPLDPFTAPANIPTNIDRTHEDPPPVSGTGVVVSMVNTGTGGLGPMGAIGLDAPSPPVVKVTPPKALEPTKVSSGVVAGNKLSGSNPVYPPIAKAARVSGAVVLHAVISKTGTIQSLSVISGPEMLRANAVSAVQDWRYKPYLLNGESTEVETTITVNFSFSG